MAGAAGGGTDFGGGLTGAAHAIVAEARTALSKPDLTNPDLAEAVAVHAVRKALKRWRALMRLLARPLGEEADAMRAEARALMRELASARDAQSALDALDDLKRSKQGKSDTAGSNAALSATAVESIRRRLTDIRNAAEKKSFTPEMRARLTHYLDGAASAIERWPLAQMDFDAVGDVLANTYRRARRRVPEDWASVETEQLHDLRQRVVEHRHQMDIVESSSPRPDSRWARDIHSLRQQLGACQDLAMLADFAAPHRPLAPWRSRLAPAIAARRNAHVRSAARLAGRLFAEKPKAFRKRVASLWNARDGKKKN